MPQDDTTRSAGAGRFKLLFRLSITYLEGKEIPIAHAEEAAQECLILTDTIITLLMMVDPYRLDLFGSTNLRSLLLSAGELSTSLLAEASSLLEKLEAERKRLSVEASRRQRSEAEPSDRESFFGKDAPLERIAYIISKTRLMQSDQCEIEDDEALGRIRDVIFEAEGKEEK